MTGPRPLIDASLVTELTPDQWQSYLLKAHKALRQNPQDEEALQAISDANFALSAYDQAEAASPGERIQAGVEGGLKGLGQAALDVPRGLAALPGMIAHPIDAVKGLAKVPQALYQGVTSDNPEQVARTVGDIGGLLLPGAKMGAAAKPLAGVGVTPETTAGGAALKVAGAGLRNVRDVASLPLNIAKRQRATRITAEARAAKAADLADAQVAAQEARRAFYEGRTPGANPEPSSSGGVPSIKERFPRIMSKVEHAQLKDALANQAPSPTALALEQAAPGALAESAPAAQGAGVPNIAQQTVERLKQTIGGGEPNVVGSITPEAPSPTGLALRNPRTGEPINTADAIQALHNEIRATTETMARKQRGALPKQLRYRAEKLGLNKPATPPAAGADLATEIRLAVEMGTPLEEVAAKLQARGVTPEQITAALQSQP